MVALLAAITVIAIATLVPQEGEPFAAVGVFCLRCGSLGGPDLVLNLILFMPLGIALHRFGLSPLRAVAAAGLVSVAVELLQFVVPGRFPTLRDVLVNALSGGLGTLVAARAARWIAPSMATTMRRWAVVTLAIGMVGMTGRLWRIAPSPTPYWGHWSPRQEHLEPWTGTVALATLDGIPVVDSLLSRADELRRAIADGFELDVRGIAGQPTARLGGIVTISDETQHEVVLVGTEGADLVVRARRRAADFRADAPASYFRNALAQMSAGTPFRIRAEVTDEVTCVDVNGTRRCLPPLAAGSAWRAIRSLGQLGATGAGTALDALTLLLVALPIGMLLPSARRAEAVAAVGVFALGIVAAAVATGLALPNLLEMFGSAGGLTIGWLLARKLVRVGPPHHRVLDSSSAAR